MKNNIKIGLFLFLFSCSFIIKAQQNEVASALSAGNVQALSTYFSDVVALLMIQEQNTYSKSQATVVIQRFFEKNKPISFTINHEGKQEGNQKNIVGTLKTNPTNFKVYISFKQKESTFVIQEIRFEL